MLKVCEAATVIGLLRRPFPSQTRAIMFVLCWDSVLQIMLGAGIPRGSFATEVVSSLSCYTCLGRSFPIFIVLKVVRLLRSSAFLRRPFPSQTRAIMFVLCRDSVLQIMLGAGIHEGVLRPKWSHHCTAIIVRTFFSYFHSAQSVEAATVIGLLRRPFPSQTRAIMFVLCRDSVLQIMLGAGIHEGA